MTDQPQPPPYDNSAPAVHQVLVADKPTAAVPRTRGLGVIVLGIIVAMLAGYVAVLLIDARRGQAERRQLACEVQRLGGRGIGGVDCPSPSPSPSPAPTAVRLPTPVPVVIVTPPAGQRGPSGQRGPAGPPAPAARQARATPGAAASSPSPAATARPSPTPTCRLPNPLPTGRRCLAPGAAARP